MNDDDCRAEECPMWDGDSCPCDTFGLDPDALPTRGVFTVSVDSDGTHRPVECPPEGKTA